MRTFSLGDGADVVKFTLATANNENNITGFTVTGTTADKLNFDVKTFDGSSGFSDLTTLSSATTEITSGKIYVGTKSQIQGLTGATSATKKTYVAVVNSGDGVGEIYAVNDANNSAAADLVLIGTIDNVTGLAKENFAVA